MFIFLLEEKGNAAPCVARADGVKWTCWTDGFKFLQPQQVTAGTNLNHTVAEPSMGGGSSASAVTSVSGHVGSV